MKIIFFDIETLAGMFLFCAWDKEQNIWYDFIISKDRNDLDLMIKFFERNKDAYFCGFNTVSFDSQVVEYILRLAHKWFDHDLTGQEIVDKIYQRAQDTIENSNYELPPIYWEDEISFKQIDIYKIPHFDNKARRASLKWLEFMMDMPQIEEMPIHHSQKDLSKEDERLVIEYCHVDIKSTERWYNYMIGNVKHEMYAGKNKIQERLDAIEEFKFPARAINWSDVKIGDELNRIGYCNLANIEPKKLYDLKKNRQPTKPFSFGDCIPGYVSFTTPEFRTFFDSISNVRVNLGDGEKNEQAFPFTFKGTSYLIARGGIHSNESNRVIIPAKDEILRDADIGSQYPNAIVKRKLFPSHLGEEWLVNYKKTIETRIEYKKKSKDNPKYKGLSEQFKLALNGGGFGKTNERTSWQYDPKVTFYCTIGNQFEILMLIEMLETSGIHVVSANTDGITALFHKDKEDLYNQKCKEWEVIVGNDQMGMLEYQDYAMLWQESVNHYIAVKPDNSLKIKGRFDIYGELQKNNTDKVERITRLAIQEWVKSKTPVEETINSCTDIYMFCIGKKASKDYRWETIKDGKRTEYKRLIRFYVSKNGEKLIKVKNEDSDATGAEITEFFKDKPVTICNNIDVADIKMVDRDYYIHQANEIITKIEANKKKGSKKIIYNKQQTSLF